MRFLISFIAALALTGCQSFYEQPVPLRDAPIMYTKVLVTLVSPKWPFQDRTQGGMSIYRTNKDGAARVQSVSAGISAFSWARSRSLLSGDVARGCA